MRIAFVAGCLEPGRDGVGDYVRTLASECVVRGHSVRLVALGEPAEPAANPPDDLPTFRQTATAFRADAGTAARRWLDDFAPDWVSLHFVPYSFDPRGLFGRTIPALATALGGAPHRHIFFHETWIGCAQGSPWRARLIGNWQRRATRRLLRALRPLGVHTTIAYHRGALATLGQPAKILRMFGSVPLPATAPVRADWPGVSAETLVCGMFGAVHPDWAPASFLADFAALAARERRPAALVAAGALRNGEAFFQQLAADWRGRVACVALGGQSPGQLAQTFARFDFAVSALPWPMVGKSSSAAAMREHGLRVVVTRAGVPPRYSVGNDDLGPGDAGFVPYFRDPALLASAPGKTAPRPGAALIAPEFLSDLIHWQTRARKPA